MRAFINHQQWRSSDITKRIFLWWNQFLRIAYCGRDPRPNPPRYKNKQGLVSYSKLAQVLSHQFQITSTSSDISLLVWALSGCASVSLTVLSALWSIGTWGGAWASCFWTSGTLECCWDDFWGQMEVLTQVFDTFVGQIPEKRKFKLARNFHH